jgi:hypothetical protein
MNARTVWAPHVDAKGEMRARGHRQRSLPQSSSASRRTASQAGFFSLRPVGRAARPVVRILPLRDDAFESQLASMVKYDLAVVVLHVLVQPQSSGGLGEHRDERGLAYRQRLALLLA